VQTLIGLEYLCVLKTILSLMNKLWLLSLNTALNSFYLLTTKLVQSRSHALGYAINQLIRRENYVATALVLVSDSIPGVIRSAVACG
jgi:hypothetical protein